MHIKPLKKYYFIEKFEKSNIDKQSKNTSIIYRNYKKKYKISEIILLRDYCRKKKMKFFLSNNIKRAINLDLDGAYIPSFNTSLAHLNYSFKKKFKIIGSAHNIKQIRIKELQNVSKIFLSSIFKANKNFLGINKFKLTSKLTKKDIVVLGGITKKNIKLIKLVDCKEFAGISFFE